MKNKIEVSKEREKFGSRLGFILISAGCAIGLGNVWRFPYIVGQYGGAAIILLYLLFLVIFGLPIMTMEFSVGRASQKSIADSFRVLEPARTKWHLFGWVGMLGNYLLMMFYTTVTGWMVAYLFKAIRGDFTGTSEYISSQFDTMVSNPWVVVGCMVLVTIVGFGVCSFGLKKGVERVNKAMMILLLAIIVVLAVYVCTLDGAKEGLKYYRVPDFKKMFERNFGEVVFAALGQAFFTLSIGMGSIAIFGSYIKKDRSLFGESISIATLDTAVAFIAGLIVIPACFAFNIFSADGDIVAGPDLVFKALPNVFNSMGNGGVFCGALFFLFMVFAAMSTVTAVFENIISFGMDKWNWSRKKSCLINLCLLIVLGLPCALGFNLLSGIQPLGTNSTIMDLEDFIISNNILPLGSLVYVLFCTLDKKAWGFERFIEEANFGNGVKISRKFKVYLKYILPVILLVFWAWGNISKFLG